MSPSRRRAIGAVRGLASSEIRTQNSLAHYPGGAMLGRRASRLAPYRHYARTLTRAFRPWRLAAAPPVRPVTDNGPKYAIFRFKSDFLHFISGL